MYNGEIKSYRIKKKNKANWKLLLLWYTGIVVSFLPIFVDILVFLSQNDKITRKYWTEVCLKGDILWILATIIVLTVIDYISEDGRKRGIKKVCAVVATIMWGVVFAVWVVFKYIYAENHENNLPVATTLIIAGITLTCCSPLQVKKMEVKR